MKKYLIFIVLTFFTRNIIAQEKNDSIIHRNLLKFDFIPLYNTFFDNRVQIRFGFEYNLIINKNSYFSNYIDLGLYDDYDFTKYYNMFDENTGFYSIKQSVSVIGINNIPSYNYYLLIFRKRPFQGIFLGVLMDFSYYKKRINFYNTQTIEKYNDNYSQLKIGTGLDLGVQYYLSNHISLELRTSIFKKILNYISKEGKNPMRSYEAQWTSPNYQYWWISNIKIGYAF